MVKFLPVTDWEVLTIYRILVLTIFRIKFLMKDNFSKTVQTLFLYNQFDFDLRVYP